MTREDKTFYRQCTPPTTTTVSNPAQDTVYYQAIHYHPGNKHDAKWTLSHVHSFSRYLQRLYSRATKSKAFSFMALIK